MRLLFLEHDDPLIRRLEMMLEIEGYVVDVALDAQDGELQALSTPYDLLLIGDVVPPPRRSALLRRLRAGGLRAPILVLSAHEAVRHRVDALTAGADDYLIRPFAREELLTRLWVLQRRANRPATHARRLQTGPLVLDRETRSALWAGTPLPLRPKEYALLALFLVRANRLIPRTTLADLVWDTPVTDDTINTTVSGLRKTLRRVDSAAAGVRIETVRGMGYQFVTAEPVTPSAPASPSSE